MVIETHWDQLLGLSGADIGKPSKFPQTEKEKSNIISIDNNTGRLFRSEPRPVCSKGRQRKVSSKVLNLITSGLWITGFAHPLNRNQRYLACTTGPVISLNKLLVGQFNRQLYISPAGWLVGLSVSRLNSQPASQSDSQLPSKLVGQLISAIRLPTVLSWQKKQQQQQIGQQCFTHLLMHFIEIRMS